MPWQELFTVLLATAAATLAAVLLLWLWSIRLRDVSIIDMAFAAIIAAVILLAWWIRAPRGEAPALIVTLVSIWAARMTIYLVRRNWGHGEDPRYTKLRSWVPEGRQFHWLSLRQVFLLQGVVIWVLTLPQQIAMVTGDAAGIGPWALAGSAVWLIGFLFETVGDWQLARFKANPDNRGKVLDSGLWRYTRHPNYFGELSQWWGLFLIALEAPWAWCGVIGPILYSHLVINVTGQATLDKKLAREKPEYADYIRRTSGLIPRPPRRS
jgi:steroid 5-alpha reductase family enzyme